MTALLIQITIAIGIFIAGYGLGELVRAEVVENGEHRPRWPWLTSQRVSGALLVLLALSGIMTTYSVRACQSEYNQNFVNRLNDRGNALDTLYTALIDLANGVIQPGYTPEQRVGVINKFKDELEKSKRQREANPLPPHPQC